jgi:hypothetical protein
VENSLYDIDQASKIGMIVVVQHTGTCITTATDVNGDACRLGLVTQYYGSISVP